MIVEVEREVERIGTALAATHNWLWENLTPRSKEAFRDEARYVLRLLARAARGSMRDALSLTDQAIAFGSGSLAEAGVRVREV